MTEVGATPCKITGRELFFQWASLPRRTQPPENNTHWEMIDAAMRQTDRPGAALARKHAALYGRENSVESCSVCE